MRTRDQEHARKWRTMFPGLRQRRKAARSTWATAKKAEQEAEVDMRDRNGNGGYTGAMKGRREYQCGCMHDTTWCSTS
jgi:hypothetical protein